MRKRRLSTHFSISLITAILFPLIVGGLVFYIFLSDRLTETYREKNLQIIEMVETEVDIFLDDMMKNINEVLLFKQNLDFDNPLLQEYLNAKIYADSKVDMIQILDTDFLVKAVAPYDPSFIDLDLSLHPSITKTQEGMSLNWSKVFLSPDEGLPYVTLSIESYNFIIVFYINLDFLMKTVSPFKSDASGFAFLLDSDGNFISHPNPEKIVRRDNLRNYDEVMNLLNHVDSLDATIISDNEIISLRKHLRTSWIVGFNQNRGEEFNLIRNLILSALIIVLIALFLVILFSSRTILNIVRPIRNIIKVTSHVRQGEYKISSHKSSILEFDELTDNFNDMLSTVRQREQDLQDLHHFLSKVVDSMPSALFSVDSGGLVTLWNQKAVEMTGIDTSEALGKSVENLLPDFSEEIKLINISQENNEIINKRKQIRHSGQEITHEDIVIFPLKGEGTKGAVVRIEDITNQVRMEEMMIQNEKMLSLGGLAAGMAHEINNPLAGIVQTANVLLNRLSRNIRKPSNLKKAEEAGVSVDALERYCELNSVARMLESMREAGMRMSEIITNMLSFSRKSEDFRSSHDMVQLLEKTLDLASTDFDLKKKYDFRNIEILKSYEPGLPNILCEEGKIRQVLMNLFKNGAQAMEEAGVENPRFRINLFVDEAAKMLVLEIQDNGPGMPPEVQKRIFEPFFTTKAKGTGTGLGLSLSYFIITENHGGQMTVESPSEGGARFTIRLPIQG